MDDKTEQRPMGQVIQLIEAAKLDGIDLPGWKTDNLRCIADHNINGIG